MQVFSDTINGSDLLGTFRAGVWVGDIHGPQDMSKDWQIFFMSTSCPDRAAGSAALARALLSCFPDYYKPRRMREEGTALNSDAPVLWQTKPRRDRWKNISYAGLKVMSKSYAASVDG